MEAADDRRPVTAGIPLRLDLSAVRDSLQLERRDGSPSRVTQELNASHSPPGKHGRFRIDYFTKGADANASAGRSAVELLAGAADSEADRSESGDPEVCHLVGNTGAAGVVSSASEHSRTVHGSNTARDSSVKSDNQCGTSNSSLGNASNSAANHNKYPNLNDETKRQTEQASPPNSSPARLEGPLRKGAFSPLQSPELQTTALGVMSVGVNRKASSFTPSTNTPAKTRVARRPPGTCTTATGAVSFSSEKFNQGSSKYDGRTEKSLAAGSASGTRAQQTQKEIAQSEDVQREQQNALREELCSQTSEDSEDDDEGQYGSCDSDSSDAESLDISPKEGHSEGEEDEEGQDTAKANPAMMEMDLDDADEEDYLEGELRYNMRTGKFSKAYVVRGVASHRILFRQRRTIVGSEKGSEAPWIFPWEMRPEVDVFAAAAAATATSSGRRQQVRLSGHSGSARANARSSSQSFSPGRASGRGLADGLCQRGKPHFRQFQGREAEVDKLGDMMINERQKESVFDCLSKMAQANEWAQMMKINRNYRAFRTREGKLACHVYQEKSYIKRLPMEVFVSYEYPRLRRRFMLCCPYLHVQSQTAVDTNMNDTEVRLRRELELQNVLLSTIQLTHALREQLDFLQRASNELHGYGRSAAHTQR